MIIDRQFVFIIGAPRSGSTWLHDMLATHPEVASVKPELTVFSRYISPLTKNYTEEEMHMQRGDWVQGLPYLWNREKFDSYIKEFINAIYSAIDIQPHHKVILDKHAEYSFHTALIHYYLPNARFINLIRDGREVALSWHRMAKEKGFGNPVFEGACQDWIRFKNSAKEASKYPRHYMEVRYENLLNNTEDEIKRLFAFCDLPADTGTLKTILQANTGETSLTSFPNQKTSYIQKKEGGTWRITLSKEQLFTAKKYLGKELVKENYTDDAWGLSALDIAFFSIKSFTRHIFNKLFRK